MKKSVLFCSLLGLLMFACEMSEQPFQKDELMGMDLNETSEIQVKSGYLVFPSNSILQETLQNLHSMNEREKIEWSQNFPEFTSMINFYDQAMKAEAIFGESIMANIHREFSDLQQSH